MYLVSYPINVNSKDMMSYYRQCVICLLPEYISDSNIESISQKCQNTAECFKEFY